MKYGIVGKLPEREPKHSCRPNRYYGCQGEVSRCPCDKATLHIKVRKWILGTYWRRLRPWERNRVEWWDQ